MPNTQILIGLVAFIVLVALLFLWRKRSAAAPSAKSRETAPPAEPKSADASVFSGGVDTASEDALEAPPPEKKPSIIPLVAPDGKAEPPPVFPDAQPAPSPRRSIAEELAAMDAPGVDIPKMAPLPVAPLEPEPFRAPSGPEPTPEPRVEAEEPPGAVAKAEPTKTEPAKPAPAKPAARPPKPPPLPGRAPAKPAPVAAKPAPATLASAGTTTDARASSGKSVAAAPAKIEPLRESERRLPLTSPVATSQPELAAAVPVAAPSEPKLPAVAKGSEPKIPPTAPISEPKVSPTAPISEPKVAPTTPISEPKVAPAAAKAEPRIGFAPEETPTRKAQVRDSADFSDLLEHEKAAAKPAEPAPKAAAAAAPASPTAELEATDPRHKSARRFARVAISEIKLYRGEDVAAGRAAKDLWSRLQADISMCLSTYEKRVPEDVRAKFDYVYDELVRQLAEGDPSKLGPGAPPPPSNWSPSEAKVATAPAKAAEPVVESKAEPSSEPTTLPKPTAPSTAGPAASPSPEPAAAAPASAGSDGEDDATTVPPPAVVEAPPKPAAAAPSSDTAELEQSDPRHKSARRFARVAVSEIKLYREDDVKAGRAAKDLWSRLQADISLCIQTYEKRVPEDVRVRFDYLYDELVRQLAEGDPAKLGADAPTSTARK